MKKRRVVMSNVVEIKRVQAFINDLYRQLGRARSELNGPRVNVAAMQEVDKTANVVALFEEELKKIALFYKAGGKI
jgi:hypothetical protein